MKMVLEKKIAQLTYLPLLFPVSCYLVDEEDGLTLVDAALPNNMDAIWKAAERMGKPIVRIVLTHAHNDHIGALDGLKERNPNIKVYVSARDAKLLQGDTSLEAGEADLPIRGGIPKKVKTKPDVLLRDNDRVGSLIAIAAPGHTPGSMAFLDERTGTLLAGDAFQTRAGIAVSGQMRLGFPFPAFATWNALASYESARKLAALKPSILAAGHGVMIKNPGEEMGRAIEFARRSLLKRGVLSQHVT